MKRVLPILILAVLFTSCAGRRFSFEYDGEPFVAPEQSATAVCAVSVKPEGEGLPGFRVTSRKRAPELIARTRVQAKEVTNWEIHGYEPDALLLAGGALSTVAGVVVTPAFWVKRLFTGWGDPEDEEEMRRRIYDRHLSSWLFMGYLWAPVDYDVLDRKQVVYDTGRILETPPSGGAPVTVRDDRGRRVEVMHNGGGLYRPVSTDALLESARLQVTAYCDGESAAASIDLVPWYRQKYALSHDEAHAFRSMAPARRPYYLNVPADLREEVLVLSEEEWESFVSKVPLNAAGDRKLVQAALGTSLKANTLEGTSFQDDLPDLLAASRRTSPDIETWLFAVGIEDYDQTSPITWSRRSTELFARVAMKRLGVPAENVFLLTDDGKTSIEGLKRRTFPATAASISDQLRFLLRDVVEGDRIYLYYSGHGLPALKDNDSPYLLARDQAPDFIHSDPFFRLESVLQALSKSRADEILVFLDSCFTGVSDGVSAFGNDRAATRLVPKTPDFDNDRMVVLTAGTDHQFSNMYPEKGHRLFSYFLMKELLNKHDTVDSLYQKVFKQTRRVSRSRGGTHTQEPTMRGNGAMKLPMR